MFLNDLARGSGDNAFPLPNASKAPAAAFRAAYSSLTHCRTEHNCNRHRTKAAGQFTIVTARTKLKHVPPSFRMKRASTLA
jgi:hypothetical protein